MKHRKILLVLLLILSLALCGCGTSAAAAPTPEPAPEATPQPTPEPTPVPTPRVLTFPDGSQHYDYEIRVDLSELKHEDVPAAIERYLGGDTEGLWTRKENGKYLVDLRLANKRRLLQLGLREEHIDLSEECTMCSHEKYWSHRYTKGIRGSQAACIVLE